MRPQSEESAKAVTPFWWASLMAWDRWRVGDVGFPRKNQTGCQPMPKPIYIYICIYDINENTAFICVCSLHTKRNKPHRPYNNESLSSRSYNSDLIVVLSPLPGHQRSQPKRHKEASRSAAKRHGPRVRRDDASGIRAGRWMQVPYKPMFLG